MEAGKGQGGDDNRGFLMMIETPQYAKGNLYQLSIADLRPDPDQPRKVIDHHLSGERRYQAATSLGMTIVPGICAEGNFAEIALVENLQRQDLTAVEEAEVLQRLMVQESYTQEQLGGIVGKARTTVGDILTLNKLPLQIRDACRGDRQITRSVLIEIARRKQERGMLTAYASYRASLEKGKTTRQAKDANDPETIFALLEKTSAKIETIDTASWDEETLTRLSEAVATFRGRLNICFPEGNPGQ